MLVVLADRCGSDRDTGEASRMRRESHANSGPIQRPLRHDLHPYPSLKLNRDPLGSQFLNDSADALE
jgi:hypothetical protein